MRRRLLMERDGVMQDFMAMRLTDTMTEYSSNEVTRVIGYGFADQKNLQKVSLPNCTVIKEYGFLGSGISEIYIPNLVEIGIGTFRNCTNLKEFITGEKFNSRIDGQTFEGSGIIKADFYHINKDLGIYNYGLAATHLETLIIRNTDAVPFLGANAFGAKTTKMNTGEGKIYVPASMVDAYKTAANWSNYADQIFPLEELTE